MTTAPRPEPGGIVNKKGEIKMNGFYAVYRKRRNTSSLRVKDHIGTFICDPNRLPIKRIRMITVRNVSWWFREEVLACYN